jgi:DNA-binding response OmpR family regulator
MPKRILSVSYDESLLKTRKMLLQRQGYEVTSALGYVDAIQSCKPPQFDLLILGHSIPDKDKKQLMKAFRAIGPAPILALRRQGEDLPDGADAHIYPDDISDLLKTVDSILKANASRRD